MSFYAEQRADHYAVCGPHASLIIQAKHRQVQYGANFLAQLPLVLLSNITQDLRTPLDQREMHYFMSLAQRDPQI